MHSPFRTNGLALIAVLAVGGLTAAACGGSSSATKKPPAAKAAAPASQPAAPAGQSASSTGSGLSGAWSGQYGGAYSGTFNLSWTQAGSSLTGRIKLSAPNVTLPIHGTMNGGAIQFGTVGSVAITYSGTVSGGSMSGNYQTPKGGGPWSANKA